MDIVIASKNKDKIKEIKELLKGLPISVIGFEEGDWPKEDIIEDGKSFKENAIKKASTVARITGFFSLADDSGLEVDVLGGRPGIYSARFAGKNATYNENNLKLLQLLDGIPMDRRTAQFRCVVAIAQPSGGEVRTVEGICQGFIEFNGKGRFGFGYDPLFIYSAYNKTFAELEPSLKNKISHRAHALEKAKIILERLALNDKRMQQ